MLMRITCQYAAGTLVKQWICFLMNMCSDLFLLQGVVDSCVFIHQAVERRSKKYYEELRRWGRGVYT